MENYNLSTDDKYKRKIGICDVLLFIVLVFMVGYFVVTPLRNAQLRHVFVLGGSIAIYGISFLSMLKTKYSTARVFRLFAIIILLIFGVVVSSRNTIEVGYAYLNYLALYIVLTNKIEHVLPYDYAPNNAKERERIRKKQWLLFRALLMKDGYKPWNESNGINLKKRIGYLPVSLYSRFITKQGIISQYMRTINNVEDRSLVYEQTGKKYYEASWMRKTTALEFEGYIFPAVDHYHEWLSKAYGDYMTPPPPQERENRHQIYKLDFGE